MGRTVIHGENHLHGAIPQPMKDRYNIVLSDGLVFEPTRRHFVFEPSNTSIYAEGVLTKTLTGEQQRGRLLFVASSYGNLSIDSIEPCGVESCPTTN